MRILIDVDGVLGDWQRSYLTLYRELGGRKPRSWAWKRFRSHEDLPDFKQLDPHIWRSRSLFEDLEVYPGVRPALYRLNQKHSVYFATALPPEHHKVRDKWFEENFPFIYRQRQVIYSNAKWILKADVHIEDQPQRLAPWLAKNPEGRGYLVNHLWNRSKHYEDMLNSAGEGRWERVNSFTEAAEAL